jgi:hypothetical protein
MSASDLPGDAGGSYTWSTTSTKLRLINTAGTTIAIEALTTPGTARDSEVITVIRTATDGSQTKKTVSITVATVRFSPSVTQRYGYDDFDTRVNGNDDHVSIMSGEATFVAVKIEGGAVGADFDFSCDNPAVCMADPAPEKPRFDLKIKAEIWQKKATILRARARCPSSAVFAEITMNVYSEKVVEVVVAKIANNTKPATRLKYSTADYAAHQVLANDKLRQAVVKFDISNYDPANGVMNIPYDADASGAFVFDINAAGGKGVELIDAAVTASAIDQYRVVIVRALRSYYYLERPAKKGDRSISVRGTNVFTATMPLGTGATREMVTVTSHNGNVGNLAAPLAHDHNIGETLEFPAAAWSTDPIVISEGNASLDETKWTILHEVGHRALKLQDIVDKTNFMNASQGTTDFRLRYCPRDSAYDPGVKENQWETIPRPLPKLRG